MIPVDKQLCNDFTDIIANLFLLSSGFYFLTE